MFELRYLTGVATIQLRTEACIGCGACTMVCPHGVIAMNGRHAVVEDRDACMECGACARNCPAGAVLVQSGVGCAAAVINAALGRRNTSCCCIAESSSNQSSGGGCC